MSSSYEAGAMCPVFRPSREEFDVPFCEYVRKVFRKHPDMPMFKVGGWAGGPRGRPGMGPVDGWRGLGRAWEGLGGAVMDRRGCRVGGRHVENEGVRLETGRFRFGVRQGLGPWRQMGRCLLSRWEAGWWCG